VLPSPKELMLHAAIKLYISSTFTEILFKGWGRLYETKVFFYQYENENNVALYNKYLVGSHCSDYFL
jgi:hypothetical protein